MIISKKRISLKNINFHAARGIENSQSIRPFSTTVRRLGREDHQDRSANWRIRYDVLSFLGTKRDILANVQNGTYDKEDYANQNQKDVSMNKIYAQESQAEELSNRIERSPILSYIDHKKAKRLCESAPTANLEYNFPGYSRAMDQEQRDWLAENPDFDVSKGYKEDDSNNNSSGNPPFDSSAGPSSGAPSSGGPSSGGFLGPSAFSGGSSGDPSNNQFPFLYYILIIFSSFAGYYTDYIEIMI